MRTTRRAKSILNRLIEGRKISRAGVEWLTIATDPFHDTEITPTGYPDMNTCNSISQCFTFTQNVSAPGTGIWDAHIFLNPVSRLILETIDNGAMAAIPTYEPRTGKFTTAANNIVPIHAGYNILTGATGQKWNVGGLTPYTNVGPSVAYPLTGSAGQYRLVSAGYEVVNTTPELYKGGAVTVYRSPSHPNVPTMQVWNLANNYAEFVNGYMAPPDNQAEAQLYPSSKTWAAEFGVYSTATLSSESNPYLQASVNTPFMYKPPSIQDLISNTPSVAFTIVPSLDSGQTGATGTTGQVLPYDIHGCFFTGLNPNATLQVTVKYYVERIPTVTEPDLLVLTRKSPDYDPMALELYTHTLAELPVGVQVGENPLGEWFDDVLSTVAQFAAPLGAVFGPMGTAAGTALAGGANTWLNTRKNERNPLNSLGPAPPPPPRTTSRPKQQKKPRVQNPQQPARKRKPRKPKA